MTGPTLKRSRTILAHGGRPHVAACGDGSTATLYRIRCRCSHHLRRKPAQVRSITHIAFSLNSGEVRAAVALQGFTTTGSVCDPASDTFTRNLYVIDSPPQFFTDQFPTPIQWRAPTGQKACLVASGVPGAVGRLEVSGYLVG
jgi:hypothetical protein